MYEYLLGIITELTPTYLILENNGIGYFINITLNTYSSLKANAQGKLYIHEVIREDVHLLYGFSGKPERDVFRMLISVSGIGASTARMVLSSLSADEVIHVIANEKVNILQKIKGIGAKTAQRIIVDLKEKANKVKISGQILIPEYNRTYDEALSALVILGFSKLQVEKVLNQISRENKDITLEEMIKKALQVL
jgi:Holliday junction DNA helicase RuvA